MTTDKVHNFEREEQFLTFAAYESFFIFNGEYYTQVGGVAMWSPLGPTLANAFLSHFEEKWLSACIIFTEWLQKICWWHFCNF